VVIRRMQSLGWAAVEISWRWWHGSLFIMIQMSRRPGQAG